MKNLANLARKRVSSKLLVFGLGNPGNRFSSTKHNMGYWVIDRLAKMESINIDNGEPDYIYGENDRLILIKPTTYMNNSGVAVAQATTNFSSSKVLVAYDDIDLPLGGIRYRSEGGDGGHRGIESMIYHLNSDRFDRLRLGIATSENMRPSEEYVLKPFKRKYDRVVNDVVDYAAQSISYYQNHSVSETMNKFNSMKRENE